MLSSKEALDLIATNCAMNCKKAYHEKCSESCEVLKAFQVVKKDLEILDIVRKYVDENKLLEPYRDYHFLIMNAFNEEEDFNKFKEWLENEIH